LISISRSETASKHYWSWTSNSNNLSGKFQRFISINK